jgi:hypothetical protein
MAGFTLGVVVALFVGVWLGQMHVAAKGKRSDYAKAKAGLPGLRKGARAASIRYLGYLLVVILMVVALMYGVAANGEP